MSKSKRLADRGLAKPPPRQDLLIRQDNQIGNWT